MKSLIGRKKNLFGKAKENIETELNKGRFQYYQYFNNADISDDANYIKNLGQKAATKALAQAQADIAEEKKKRRYSDCRNQQTA